MVSEQARMLKEYEDKQNALQASRAAEEAKAREAEMQRQREFEEMQRQQAERERLAQEELLRQQQMQQQMANAQMNDFAAQRMQEIEREMLAMRGQYERDQMLLEQYDRVSGYAHSMFIEAEGPLCSARQSARRRALRHLRQRRVPASRQGRPHPPTHRTGQPLARQIRGTGESGRR